MGQVRTMASALYARMAARIQIGHPMMKWITRYAAVVLNRRMVGSDGKTAQQHITVRRSLKSVCEFGERVMFRISGARSMGGQGEWQPGVWLGVVGRSEEALVGISRKSSRGAQ